MDEKVSPKNPVLAPIGRLLFNDTNNVFHDTNYTHFPSSINNTLLCKLPLTMCHLTLYDKVTSPMIYHNLNKDMNLYKYIYIYLYNLFNYA